jgi:hypothetical protein
MKRKVSMKYNVCTMAGAYQIENQRFWRKNFMGLEKAIFATRQQHAEMANDVRYTLVVALEKADTLVSLANEN